MRDSTEGDGDGLPKTLVFCDPKGSLTLNGLQVSKRECGPVPSGRARPQLVFFGRAAEVRDEYAVREVASTLDGIEEFAGFSPMTLTETFRPEAGVAVRVDVDASEVVHWAHGEFEFEIRANLAWRATEGRSFTTESSAPLLVTKHPEGATVQEHIGQQRAIRALLTLAFGRPLRWRSHRAKDSAFPIFTLDGQSHPGQSIEVQYRQTVRKLNREAVPHSQLFAPALSLRTLGSEGLKRWMRLYDDEGVRRAVDAAVAVFDDVEGYLEPQMMMLATALERFAHYWKGGGKADRLARSIERCLENTDVQWEERLGTTKDIAKFLACINNDLKHADRPSFPDGAELYCAVDLAEIVVRMQLVKMLDLGEVGREGFEKTNDFRNAIDGFERNSVSIQ
ncbi:hypothetical protein ACFQRD_16090 [Brachybacterium sp. GCM10030268]|uniref:ApeA N-terminal domain 1-containing protein n=1 Tax=Brachybacterium sp. GCM10030268 TaxID=3273382 RepID=UPI003620F046